MTDDDEDQPDGGQEAAQDLADKAKADDATEDSPGVEPGANSTD